MSKRIVSKYKINIYGSDLEIINDLSDFICSNFSIL